MESFSGDESLSPSTSSLAKPLKFRSSIEQLEDAPAAHLPPLKRSSTTSGPSSRSRRIVEIGNLANLPIIAPSPTNWGSPGTSLLSQRRPSLVDAYDKARQQPQHQKRFFSESLMMTAAVQQVADSPQSPDSLGDSKGRALNFIDMSPLVGDAVGNMSISPSYRDIVLAARKGLYIIDLENTEKRPRFLPQGGTWDVADVQWNPHPSHSQYIVSTSSEKVLIWNLGITGRSAIEHVLKAHYRAITDFNWHTTECDLVASTGIDSWIWIWDLRNPRKAALGLSAFRAGGTQVKWNRQDANLLASAHGNEVLIWDRRKGSVPTERITAHSAKIYGIDWSHHLRNEIVTCSLDRTIKSWNIHDANLLEGPIQPTAIAQTHYPVWRARNLPFGQGILALPQRGETRLEMFARSERPTEHPRLVETFEGHSDVVKEFVWRKTGIDEFQLVTWSKDRTLRFWPVGPETMQSVGHMPEIIRGRTTRSIQKEPSFSYRDISEGSTARTRTPQLLSAPIGNRAILAEVRAGVAPAYPNLITQPHTGSSARAIMQQSHELATGISGTKPIEMPNRSRGGTMSRGAVTGKSVAGIEPVAWLSHVKVASKRGSSSGAGSADPDSSSSSRLNSMSRANSRDAREDGSASRHRSVSRTRAAEDGRENEIGQSLQDEVTSVLTKLSASKIKLEKHDLTKKRTVTLGLHGPWGESSSVFMRVTFTFPLKYPFAAHPEGTPSVDLERSPLISPQDRAYVLKRLKVIRETKRPCLEACLKFLSSGEDGRLLDSESSDDDDESTERKKKKGKGMTVSILRNHKNLAEPRTSQGSFGPNGELICFFRSAPRRVVQRTILRGPPATPSEEQSFQDQRDQQAQPQDSLQQSRLFQAPALVSDAVRRLRLAANDQQVLPNNGESDFNILRTMTNLLTVSQDRVRQGPGDRSKNWPFQPVLRSSIFMSDTSNAGGPDRAAAAAYVFTADSLSELCNINAQAAKECGRYDHERIFRVLRSLFNQEGGQDNDGKGGNGVKSFVSDTMAVRIVERLYKKLAQYKDVQMLAMISIVALQTPQASRKVLPRPLLIPTPQVRLPEAPQLKKGVSDYFTVTTNINSVPSSTSSRGSWPFPWTGRFFPDLTPTEHPATPTTSVPPGRVSKQNSTEKLVVNTALHRNRSVKGSPQQASPAGSMASKSWGEGQSQAPKSLSISFASGGDKRSGMLRLSDISPFVQEKRRIVFEPAIGEQEPSPLVFPDSLIQQFYQHVYVYAELLFRWELFTRRLELLKVVEKLHPPFPLYGSQHTVGVTRRCVSGCGAPLDTKNCACPTCGIPAAKPSCTICRLPVKGLSRNCLRCFHVTHISCWNRLDVPICPTGCGCFCSPLEGIYTRPSTRLGFSPLPNSLSLSAAP